MGGYLKIQIYARDLESVAFVNAIFYISQTLWRLLYGCCFKTDEPTFSIEHSPRDDISLVEYLETPKRKTSFSVGRYNL